MRTKCGGMCGSGGRNKRMGEGLGGRNLKPNSEALSLEAGTERMKALISGTHGIPSGGGGCAAHRPPHRKKRNIVTVNAKIIVTASKKALGNKAQGAAKTIGKRSPGTRQNPLK